MNDAPEFRNGAIKKFWQKVQTAGPDDCWEWMASKRLGYGAFRRWGAHRYAYKLYNPSWEPKPGDIIAHKCDNPGCVNPRHLFLTDSQGNTLDAIQKGRWRPWWRHRAARMMADNMTPEEISKAVGLPLKKVKWICAMRQSETNQEEE